MICRLGVILLGLFFLACCAGGFYVVLSGPGWLTAMVEGIRAMFFGLMGLFFVAVGVRADGSTVRTVGADVGRETFSRRNLTEFAAVVAVVLGAVAVMLLVRP